MGGRQSDEPAAMSLCGNDAMGAAGHARGHEAGRDLAGKRYAGGATTGVVTISGLKTEDLAPKPLLTTSKTLREAFLSKAIPSKHAGNRSDQLQREQRNDKTKSYNQKPSQNR